MSLKVPAVARFDNIKNDSLMRLLTMPYKPFLLKFTAGALAVALSGCTLGPPHQTPSISTPLAWKEAAPTAPTAPTVSNTIASAAPAPGWVRAEPADTHERGDWWELFGDATLNQLAAQLQISNHNIAAAVANYAQAEALLAQQNAALWPSLTLSGSGQRNGGSGSSSDSYNASLSANWSLDVWGRLRNSVSSVQAQAQASQADLGAARLSALGALARNYFNLRAADAEIALLTRSVQGYQRALEISRNQYQAGIAAQTDVLQAQTQLLKAQASRIALHNSRATLEHALAVLVGRAPAEFSLASQAAPSSPAIPAIPPSLPSTLLQRRPDIAAAERAVAAANARIGVAQSAYYPALSLSAASGSHASHTTELFSAPAALWSLGISLAQVVFDAGANRAGVAAAQAAHSASVAQYRQTVLAAFQSVEDQLSSAALLAQQEQFNAAAAAAAERAAEKILNRYQAAQLDYASVVVAQNAALEAQRSLLQTQAQRQTTAVALIQALGGGWHAPWGAGELAERP